MFESLRINGQFFNLKTDLVFSSENGYKASNSVIYRNHPLKDDYFFNDYDVDITSKQASKSKIISSVTSKSIDEIDNCVVEISKLLNIEVCIIEFNFDKINVFLNKEKQAIAIESHKIIKDKLLLKSLDKLKVRQDNFINSLLFNPIIPKSDKDIEIHNQIIEKYLPELKSIIGAAKAGFYVFTGERIWTNWLDDVNIHKILNEIFDKNTYICIDRDGLWESILHNSIKNDLNKSINKKMLAPNAYFYVPTMKSEKILAYNEEKLKRILLLDEGVTVFEGLEGYMFKDTLLPEKLFVKGMCSIKKNTKFNSKLKINEVYTESNTYKANQDALVNISDNNISLSIESGTNIKVGMKIGGGFIRKGRIVNVNNDLNDKFKLLISQGEDIKKGDLLASNDSIYGKIMGEVVTSPYSGTIDLDRIDKGYVFVRDHETTKYDYISTFEGKLIKNKYKNVFQIRADNYQIPLKISTGNIFGKLIRKIDINDLQTKVLFVNNISDITDSVENLIRNNVVGIILTHLSYADFEYLLKQKTDLIDLLSINVISAFGIESDSTIMDLINKYNNYYISIENNQLFLLADVQKQQNDSNKNPSKLFSGKRVQLLSYTSKLMYYRIMKKISDNTYLVGNDEGMVESDVSNILFC
jgi:hypothetical protein